MVLPLRLRAMRNSKLFIRDILKKMPVVFPLVAGFHVLWLCITLTDFKTSGLSSEFMIRASWMILFTIFWIAACDRRKWGAMGYLTLTLIDISLFIFLKTPYQRLTYLSSLYLLDAIFSFFLLFYFKQFE